MNFNNDFLIWFTVSQAGVVIIQMCLTPWYDYPGFKWGFEVWHYSLSEKLVQFDEKLQSTKTLVLILEVFRDIQDDIFRVRVDFLKK